MSTNPQDLEREYQYQYQTGPYRSITFSWLNKGFISKEVRSQRGCSCCWIVAPEEAIEALHKIRSPEEWRIRLSIQEVVDCYREKYPETVIKNVDTKGCFMSTFFEFFRYITDHGVLEEDIYRFKAEKGECKSCEIKSRRLKVPGYVKLQRDDESRILKAIKKRPIIAMMTVYMDLKPLKKDVYQGPGKDQKDGCAHGMLIVGYGIENSVPYYLVKSSWGTQWGIGGYGKIARKLFRCFMYPRGPLHGWSEVCL